VSNWPPVAVSVCVTESLLVTLTLEPGATAIPDDPELPPLHAARSSAPARTRTSAPPLNRRVGSRSAQTAWDVGLNASGVPEEVCAPGYIPST
jgi:hypothetical protein